MKTLIKITPVLMGKQKECYLIAESSAQAHNWLIDHDFYELGQDKDKNMVTAGFDYVKTDEDPRKHLLAKLIKAETI